MSSVAYKCPDSLEDPLDIPGSSLGVPSQTQASMLSGGSLGHPGILPWCPLRQRPPCCLEDPLDIPGSSLGVSSDRGPHAVRRIPWISRDPPWMSPQTEAPMLSGGSLGHPGISLGVLSDTDFLQDIPVSLFFLVLIRPKDFVVMITNYNNISQESRIFLNLLSSL